MELTSISELCEANIPGIRLVEYVPTAWVDVSTYEVLRTGTWYWAGTLELLAGREWLSARLLPQRRVWEEEMQRTPQGRTYRQRVAGVVKAARPGVAGLVDAMEEYRYLLRVTDRKGRQWILGTLEQPFDFVAAMSTGETEGGLSAYTVAWTAVTLRRAVGLEVE